MSYHMKLSMKNPWRKRSIAEEIAADLEATIRARLHATEELEYWAAMQQMHCDREVRLRTELHVLTNPPLDKDRK